MTPPPRGAADTGAIAQVNACFWCDQPQSGHARVWAAGIGYHRWVPPTDSMRKRRLLARRAARTTGRGHG